jgi:hypothetical protein
MSHAVVFADPHFTPYGAWRGRNITGDALHGLTQVVDYCVEYRNDVSEVWVLGDLWERHNNDHPGAPALHRAIGQQVERLAKKRILPRWILGNHDGGVPWWGLYPQALAAGGKPAKFLGLPAFALDWTPRDRLLGAIEGIPAGTRVALLHQSWDGLMGSGSCEGKLEWLAGRGIDYLFSGDLHQVRHEAAGSLVAFSPGALCLQAINEDNVHGFLVAGRDGDDLAVEWVGIRSRPRLEAALDSGDDLEEWLETLDATLAAADDAGLPDEVKKPLVSVRFRVDIPGGPERVRAALADRGHLFLRYDAAAPEAASEPSPRLINGYQQSGGAAWAEALAAAGADAATAAGALSLMSARDVRGELRRLRDEATKGPEPCPSIPTSASNSAATAPAAPTSTSSRRPPRASRKTASSSTSTRPSVSVSAPAGTP